LISWSMPFLAEKITGMLYRILSLCADDKDEEKVSEKVAREAQQMIEQDTSKLSQAEIEKAEKRKRLKQKIIALGRMNAMLGTLRANSEVIL
jgi:serine/threonine-protein phosphatase 2B catalytic subunit